MKIQSNLSTSVISQVLIDAGLIGGGDMTPEAALSKLSYILAKKDLSLDVKKKVCIHSQKWLIWIVQT